MTNARAITLDVVGSGDKGYEAYLQSLIDQFHLEKRVRLMGRVPSHEIPTVFSKHDGFIFPSEWEEPFARVVLEAMAAGLVVIGTTTGGTGEILIEGKTGLTFPPGDARALAAQIQRLLKDPVLHKQLATNGQQCVKERFTFERMVDEIEAYLINVAQSAQAQDV
jgi:glycosyltransferase involved in cell wall biosynthesis